MVCLWLTGRALRAWHDTTNKWTGLGMTQSVSEINGLDQRGTTHLTPILGRWPSIKLNGKMTCDHLSG